MVYNNKPDIQMVLVDLDGTLLNNDKQIGAKDYISLIKLGESGILRVIATGRNLYSCLKVLPQNCPVDYLVFSSGAGIMDWKTREVLFNSSLPKQSVQEIETILRKLNLNFSIQLPVPENHKYYYHRGNENHMDFNNRNQIYSEFSKELNGNYPLDSASQFLIILKDKAQIQTIIDKFNGFKIIRATSPIDNQSIWLEIFNLSVSKAEGGKFICRLSGIPEDKTLGIGNDYNDLDMLNWVANSFIVSNAPDPIKNLYTNCTDNHDNPLTDALKLMSDHR